MRRKQALLGLMLLLVFLAPLAVGTIQLNLIVEFAIAATFALSLNLLLSYTGLLSFGHALFFGTGAYATALALKHWGGAGVLSALSLGALAACLVALICCPLLVRVSGTAFAMLTLALGQLMYVLCLKYREITGGEDGLSGFPTPQLSLFGVVSFDLRVPANFYYFALVVLGLSVLLMWWLTRTPFGSLVTGIRENEERTGYLGFKVSGIKALIFIISAGFAGISGSMFALFHNVVSTDGVLHLIVSFLPLMAILVGGIGTFSGPVLGAGLLLLLEDWSAEFTERVELVTGLAFIAVVLFAPKGVLGLFNGLVERWSGSSGDTLEETSK